QMVHQVSGDFFLVLQQNRSKIIDAAELLSCERFAGSIHGTAKPITHEDVAGKLCPARYVAVTCRAEAAAPAADDIEALECQPGRINPGMTHRTARVRTMFVELLTDRSCATKIRLDGREIRRWRIGRPTHDFSLNPASPLDRRCRRTVRRYLQDAGL